MGVYGLFYAEWLCGIVIWLFFIHCILYIAGRQREHGNLVLRHSVTIKALSLPTFRRFLEALSVEGWNSMPRFATKLNVNVTS